MRIPMIPSRVGRRVSAAAAIATLSAVGALHAWSLLRFPAPFVDEAWFASRGWALVTRGEMTGTLDKGVIDQFAHGWSFFPVLPTLVDACALAMAGAPSVLAVRLVSLAGGVTLACAMWSIARHLVGSGAAWLAVVLLALSSPFVYSSHLARSDMLAAAMGYGGVALFLSAGNHRSWLAGFGGLSASMALDMHPFAIVIAAALPVLAVARFGTSLYRFTVCRAMLAGLAAGVLFWAGVHVWPDAQGYLTLTRIFFGPTHPPSSFREWLNGPFDTLLLLWDSYLIALPPVLWAVVSLGRSTRHADKMLAILAACVFVAFSVLVRNKLHYYAILITPAFSLCLAAAISRTFESRRTSPTLSLAVLMVCAVLLIKSFSISMRFLESDSYVAYQRVQERLERSIIPRERIMASQTWWFGLHDHEYFSWEQLVFLKRFRPQSSIADGLLRLRPDVFIRDGHMDGFIRDSPGPTPYTRALRVPRTELESWLQTHARLVDDFDGANYGRVRVYRVKWPD